MKTNTLNFFNKTSYPFRYKKEFEQILNLAKEEFKHKKNISVDVLLTDNEHIREISKNTRNKDKATDILSFPTNFDDFKFLDFTPIGEIIISHQKVRAQAEEYGHSVKREFCYLFAHGLTHLFGFDHLTKEEEDEMNRHVDNMMKKMEIYR
ncbi:rRNA maturation RNase YbeY [Mycoplasma procyoni]|uniref:rRNA maturation RNase YbeY n=1 Tax=Mycoplasma procyoni TaxID=568784 RepID=UPI00197C5D69|nr:rRNA maturation RNase YbeY [Mycoplasma procyoni]MBN3534368.1 rRNA maturation RNase YbeY [Mycoplasma procyoni]